MLDQISALDLSSLSLPSIDSLDPGVLRIVLIGGLVFLFLFLFALTRHHIISYSMKGIWAGIFLGIVAVLGLEGGAYYLYTNYIVGTKGAELPQNFQVVLKDGTKSLEPVLGKAVERKAPTTKEILLDINSLSSEDLKEVKSSICKKP
ncbi:MAG: hypothetical protein AAB599_01850 [Patescibacteria group bacterium]